MDMQAEKIELVKLLLDTDNPELISKIRSVFEGNDHDFYDDLSTYQKESIQKGLKDIEEGKFRDHELVMHDVKVKYGIKD